MNKLNVFTNLILDVLNNFVKTTVICDSNSQSHWLLTLTIQSLLLYLRLLLVPSWPRRLADFILDAESEKKTVTNQTTGTVQVQRLLHKLYSITSLLLL